MNFIGHDYQDLRTSCYSDVRSYSSSANFVVYGRQMCCMRARPQLYEVTVLVTSGSQVPACSARTGVPTSLALATPAAAAVDILDLSIKGLFVM